MKKTIKYSLFIIFLLLLITILVVIFIFKNIEISSVIPPRPQGIDNSALWVGGPDGGVYVLVNKNKNKPSFYNAKIYYSEGSISYQGRLVINSPDNPLFNYNDINSYSAWDGDTLYLQDGRFLTIVNE